MNKVALTVLFQVMDQSPPFLTVFVGSMAPKVILRSPNFLTLGSSCVVESCPLSTASRLTALPEIMFFHSESGNSGQSGSLTRDCFVVLRSLVSGSPLDWGSSEINIGGLEECCNGLIPFPLLAAASISESWLCNEQPKHCI